MLNYSTEYLIIHEDEIDWDQLSSQSDDFFSLVEIRLFRKKINWKRYLLSHKNSMSTLNLEVASKYFTKEIYDEIASYNIADEDFISNHKDDFDFKIVISNCNVSAQMLNSCQEKWIDIPGIKNIFLSAKYIDIDSPDFSDIKLLLEI